MFSMNLEFFALLAEVKVLTDNAVVADSNNWAHLAAVADDVVMHDSGLSLFLCFFVFMVEFGVLLLCEL